MAIIQIRSSVQFDSNMFLVSGDRNFLIDAGTGLDSANVIGNIRHALGGRNLDGVILTHFHVDHIAGLWDIVNEFGCPAMAGPDGVQISNPGALALGREFGIEIKPVKTEVMEDGRIIDLGCHVLRIIYTPGHTSGGICIYDEKTKSLLSGDTVFSSGVGRTDFPTGSPVKLAGSLRKLSNIDIKSLYAGHGPVSTDGNRSVRYGMMMMEGYDEDD